MSSSENSTDGVVADEILPPVSKDKNNSPLYVRQEITMWQGPLPPPQVMEAYARLIPNAPERLFADFEANSQHRRDIEMGMMRGSFRILNLNLRYAFSAIVLFLVAAIFFVFYGYPSIAASLVGATMVAVVGGFLIDRSRSKKTSPPPPRQTKNVPSKRR